MSGYNKQLEHIRYRDFTLQLQDSLCTRSSFAV